MKSVWVINGYEKSDTVKSSKSWEVVAGDIHDVVAKFAAKYPDVVMTAATFRGEFEEL